MFLTELGGLRTGHTGLTVQIVSYYKGSHRVLHDKTFKTLSNHNKGGISFD